jgi:hypothetical protein
MSFFFRRGPKVEVVQETQAEIEASLVDWTLRVTTNGAPVGVAGYPVKSEWRQMSDGSLAATRETWLAGHEEYYQNWKLEKSDDGKWHLEFRPDDRRPDLVERAGTGATGNPALDDEVQRKLREIRDRAVEQIGQSEIELAEYVASVTPDRLAWNRVDASSMQASLEWENALGTNENVYTLKREGQRLVLTLDMNRPPGDPGVGKVPHRQRAGEGKSGSKEVDAKVQEILSALQPKIVAEARKTVTTAEGFSL